VSLLPELPQIFIFTTTNPTPVLEPFPFLGDVDLHPNGNSSTTIIRNPAMPRPFDIIFTTSPRVPLPQTQGRDPRNRFRGLPPPGGFYVPGMVIWYPPPVMGSLTAGGEEMGWQGVMDDEGETGINREVGGGWNGGEMAAPFITPDMSNETPFSASALRHDQKRRRSLPN
jgi:hypothetical protein